MYTTIHTTSPRASRSCPQEACAWELRSCCTPPWRNFRRHCIRHLESGEKWALSPLAYVLFSLQLQESLLLPCDPHGPRLRPSNKPGLTWRPWPDLDDRPRPPSQDQLKSGSGRARATRSPSMQVDASGPTRPCNSRAPGAAPPVYGPASAHCHCGMHSPPAASAL
jgi:hypothetical protein